MTDERYKQLMARREALEKDSARWNWLVRHASLGFDSASRWSAVIRLPVFDAADQTITALVDTARKETGSADAPKKGD